MIDSRVENIKKDMETLQAYKEKESDFVERFSMANVNDSFGMGLSTIQANSPEAGYNIGKQRQVEVMVRQN